MAAKRKASKSNWSDIGDLRRPHAGWRLGGAARWFERRLGLPAGTILFRRPNGTRARSDKTLGALREEWNRHNSGVA